VQSYKARKPAMDEHLSSQMTIMETHGQMVFARFIVERNRVRKTRIALLSSFDDNGNIETVLDSWFYPKVSSETH
jgi:hypothetical protein